MHILALYLDLNNYIKIKFKILRPFVFFNKPGENMKCFGSSASFFAVKMTVAAVAPHTPEKHQRQVAFKHWGKAAALSGLASFVKTRERKMFH